MHPCVRTYKHVARFERSGHPCPRYCHSNIHPTCISSYSSVQDTIFMRSGSDRERTFVYRAITNGWSHRIIGRTANMNLYWCAPVVRQMSHAEGKYSFDQTLAVPMQVTQKIQQIIPKHFCEFEHDAVLRLSKAIRKLSCTVLQGLCRIFLS